MKKAFKISAVLLALVVLVALSVVFAVNAEPTELTTENFQAKMENGGDFKLMADINLGASVIRIGKDVTLDLNGHTISSTYDGEGLFYVQGTTSGTFRIRDGLGGGAILAPNTALVANSIHGNVSVEGGTIVVKSLRTEAGSAKVTLKGSGEDNAAFEAENVGTDEEPIWVSKNAGANQTWVSIDILKDNGKDDFCVDGYHGIKQSSPVDTETYPDAATALYRVVPQDYRVTFRYTGNDNKAVDNTANVGEDETLIYDIETPGPINLNAPSLKGYKFLGWWAIENPGESKITMIDPKSRLYNMTLEGRFEPAVYSITYVGTCNGGNTSFENNAANPATFTNGTDTIQLKDPTKKGGTFIGWYDQAVGGNKVTEIKCAETYNDVTLYAQFELVNYKITYNGVENATHTNPGTYTVDNEVTLTPAVKTGYTFIGWFDAETEGNKVEKIALGSTEDKTLWARFEKTVYTITYDFGTVTVNNADTFPKTYTIEDDTIQLPTPAVDPGTTFVRWLDADGNPISQIVTGSYGDITVKAEWKHTEYKLFYHFGTGVGHEDVDNSANIVEYFSKYDTVTLYNAKRSHFVFDGWYDKDPLANEDAKKITEIPAGTTRDVTVYAKWTPVEYAIEYDKEGYMVVGEEKVYFENNAAKMPETIPSTYNFTTDLTLPVPTREGYAFEGWFDPATGEIITSIKAGTRDGDITGDMKLVAVWSVGKWNVTIRYIYNKDYQLAAGLTDADAIFKTELIPDVAYGYSWEYKVEWETVNGFVPDAWTVKVTGLAKDQYVDIYFEPVVISTVYDKGVLTVTYFDGKTTTIEMNNVTSIKLNGSSLVYVTADGKETVVASIATTEDVKDLQDKITALDNALKNLDAAYKAADTAIKTDLDALKKQVTDSIKALEDKIAANGTAISKNTAAIDSLKGMIEKLEKQTKTLEEKVAALEADAESLGGMDTTLLIVIIIVAVVAVAAAAGVVVLFVKKK